MIFSASVVLLLWVVVVVNLAALDDLLLSALDFLLLIVVLDGGVSIDVLSSSDSANLFLGTCSRDDRRVGSGGSGMVCRIYTSYIIYCNCCADIIIIAMQMLRYQPQL